MSNKKVVFMSHKCYKGGNRDYSSYFSVTFKTTGKLLIVSVRLILLKVGVDGFIEPRQKVTSNKKIISIP